MKILFKIILRNEFTYCFVFSETHLAVLALHWRGEGIFTRGIFYRYGKQSKNPYRELFDACWLSGMRYLLIQTHILLLISFICLFRIEKEKLESENIEELLFLLSPYLLMKPAQWVLQYLVIKNKVSAVNRF